MKEGWEYKKLGEVADFYRGLTYKREDEVDSSDNCVLRSNNIDLESMSLNFDELKYIRPDFVIPEDKKLKANSIFVCMSNGSKQHVGKVAYIKDDMDYAFGGFMGLITPKHGIEGKYIYYVCRSSLYRQFLTQIGNGIGITNLRFTDLNNFSLPVPSISEQQKIVEELDLLSSIIEKKKEQLKELDALAQSIFYDMFGDPVTNEKGWEMKKLGDVCNEIGDGLHGTPKYDPNGSIAFINGNNLIDRRIAITERTQFVNEEEAKKIYIKLDNNTILLSINGTLGKTAIYNNEKIVLGKSACYLKLKDRLNILFVMALMNTNTFQFFLESNSSKSTIKNVGLKAIRNYKIILPPLFLQQQFASKIEAIEQQKELIKQSIKETETLFNSRMDYYFN